MEKLRDQTRMITFSALRLGLLICVKAWEVVRDRERRKKNHHGKNCIW